VIDAQSKIAVNRLTNLARIPLLIVEYAEQSGIDRGDLLQRASLSAENLSDPDKRISVAALLELWRAVLEKEDDTAIGVSIGSTCSAKRLGIVGYAMYYSRDLLQAFQRFARYVHIISEAVQIDIATEGEQTTVSFSAHPSLFALRHPVEAQIAALMTVGREITQTDLVPLAIHLPFPHPGASKRYKVVFRCPVHFEQPHAAIVFTAAQMRLAVTASDPTLSGYLDELASSTLDALAVQDEGFVDAVRRALWSESPGGKPNLWRTASEMGISVRTLQRHLRENGTSFSAVLEELRRELAGDLIANKELAVSDVAFLLGYSEPSAFRRAFRRWHGVSPRRFRSA